MKISLTKVLGSLLIVGLLLGCQQGGLASQTRTITLEEALELAFKHNTSHALFLWEQELIEKREELKGHPQITAQVKPAGVADGKWEKPEGSLTVKMPLGQNIDLNSTLKLKLDKSGVDFTPAGSLALAYSFFARPENGETGLSVEENSRLQANGLVSQTVGVFIELRQKLDLQRYEEGRYRYLEASLEAARLTPNYDDFKLKKEFREQATKLAQMQEELDQLQVKLARMLGESETTTYDPVLTIKELDKSLLEDDFLEELLLASGSFRKAQAELTSAQKRLEHEQKTKGWDVKATGGISANDPLALGWHWNAGITASKTLYPSKIILEELELALTKAEHAVQIQKSGLQSELQSLVQMVRSAINNVELKAEHLNEAKDDWSLRKRQYEAGLVTELQVEEARLALEKADLDYVHSQMTSVQSILNLWHLCGRDLRMLVFEVVN